MRITLFICLLFITNSLFAQSWLSVDAIQSDAIEAIHDIEIDSNGYIYIAGAKNQHAYLAYIDQDYNILNEFYAPDINSISHLKLQESLISFSVGEYIYRLDYNLNLIEKDSVSFFIKDMMVLQDQLYICGETDTLVQHNLITYSNSLPHGILMNMGIASSTLYIDNDINQSSGDACAADKNNNLYLAGNKNDSIYIRKIPIIGEADNYILGHNKGGLSISKMAIQEDLIILCGNTSSLLTIDNQTFNPFEEGNNFMICINTNGEFQWITAISPYIGEINDIIIINENSLLITGAFERTIFQSGDEFFTYNDFFIAEYNLNGNQLWLDHSFTYGNDAGYAFAQTENKGVFIVGSFEGSISLGNKTLYSINDEPDFLIIQMLAQNITGTSIPSKDIVLFPNPVKEKISIQSEKEYQHYSIINMQGQEIEKGIIKDNSIRVSLTKGSFLLQIDQVDIIPFIIE